jgi:hypothetical protein
MSASTATAVVRQRHRQQKPEAQPPQERASKFLDDHVTAAQAVEAAKQYLKTHGFTVADYEKLQLTAYNRSAQAANRVLRTLAYKGTGFAIPYFKPDGRLDPTFSRYRYTLHPPHEKASKEHPEGKEVRYCQPQPGVLPYLASYADWPKVMDDVQTELIFAESEMKAALLCKLGLTAIAFGGVWAFGSKKQGFGLHPLLQQFQWKGRRVYICYDSDAAENPNVMQAEQKLADQLTALGAVVLICRLPNLEDREKTDVNDYFVAGYSLDDFKTDVLATAVEHELCRALLDMNKLIAYVRDPGVVLELRTNRLIGVKPFTEHAYRNYLHDKQVIKNDGSVDLKKVQTATEWLEWKGRTEYERQVFEPGKDVILPNPAANGYPFVNTWQGWPHTAKEGDTEPFDTLVDYLTRELTKEQRQWLWQWMAYPIQHPGTKMFGALVLWSKRQGTGKSLFSYIYKNLYDPIREDRYSIEIGNEQLYGSHNDWQAHKLLIIGDEISSSQKREEQNRLKSRITQPRVLINAKYIPHYTLEDRSNWIFTSNHPDAVFIDNTDRRFFIVHAPEAVMEDSEYARIEAWWRSPDGMPALMYKLQHISLKGFNPAARPPTTDAKNEMDEANLNDLGTWVRELRNNPDYVLNRSYELWTAVELYEQFITGRMGKGQNSEDEQRKRRNTYQVGWLGQELQTQGFWKIPGQPRVKDIRNGQVHKTYLWAVRDADKWKQVDSKRPQIAGTFYDAERAKEAVVKY